MGLSPSLQHTHMRPPTLWSVCCTDFRHCAVRIPLQPPVPMSSPAPSADLTDSGTIATAVTPAAASAVCRPRPLSAEWAHPPRHGHDEPSAAAEPAASNSSSSNNRTAAAQSSRPTPPGARLHRHALESILAFSDLNTLTAALRVSKEWLDAVGSMGRLGFTAECRTALIESVSASAMARHVGDLEVVVNVRMSADEAESVAVNMPHLRRLQCWVPQLPADGPLLFPAGLRELVLLVDDSASAAEINTAIAGAGRLEQLDTLNLRLRSRDSLISFAPLAALLRLRAFSIDGAADVDFSDAQVAELRALPRLHTVRIDRLTIGDLRRLLRRPHDLQWQHVALMSRVDEETGALLTQLPSLTRIREFMGCERFEWMSGLPNLTDVDFWLDASPAAEGRAASLVAGLAHCAAVTRLALAGATDLTAAHFAELLPRLPRLQSLVLTHLDVDSLGFLSQAPLTSQLSSLVLSGCTELPLSELSHVHSLRGLKLLSLFESFTAPMDAHSLSLFEPPSSVLPLLESFEYEAPPPAEQHDSEAPDL